MTTIKTRRWLLLALLGSIICSLPLQANLMIGYAPNLIIPDDCETGLVQRFEVNADFTSIFSISLKLEIEGGYNGDYYAYLTHGSGFAVLLNRPGLTAVDDLGYADSGLNVRFSNFGMDLDIHQYQNIINPMGGPLTGDWAADGRNTNPLSVLDTDLRTARMDRFSSLDPNGEWVLFIADLSAGGVGTLKSFELEISGVPEPSHYSAVGAFALAIWTLIRRFQRKPSTPGSP